MRSPGETSQLSRLVGTPPHTLLVHYPVALATVVPALDLLARAGSDGDSGVIRTAAYLSLAAMISGALAAAPGLVDWGTMVKGSSRRRIATVHLSIQSSVIALLAASFALRWSDRSEAFAPWPATVVALAAFVVMSVGNFFGGELVYRLGMRVTTAERGEEMRRAS